MPAPRIGQMSRFSEFENAVRAGAEMPVLRTGHIQTLAQSLTDTFRFYAACAGTIRDFNIYSAITGTVTIDIKKNGTSVLSGTFTLTNNTVYKLRGLGTGGVASNFFNTVSDANRAKLRYEDGDFLEVSIVTSGASTVAAPGLTFTMTCDEKQYPIGNKF